MDKKENFIKEVDMELSTQNLFYNQIINIDNKNIIIRFNVIKGEDNSFLADYKFERKHIKKLDYGYEHLNLAPPNDDACTTFLAIHYKDFIIKAIVFLAGDPIKDICNKLIKEK